MASPTDCCAEPGQLRRPAFTVPFPFPPLSNESWWEPSWTCDAESDDETAVLQVAGRTHLPYARNATRAWQPAMDAVGVGWQDGGRSVLITPNVALWTFGDTIPSHNHGGPWFKNTGMLVRRSQAGAPGDEVAFTYMSEQSKADTATCVVPYDTSMAPDLLCNNTSLWPANGATVGSGASLTAFVYFQVVRHDKPDVLGVASAPVGHLAEDAGGPAGAAAATPSLSFTWVRDDLPFLVESSLVDPADPGHVLLLFNHKSAGEDDQHAHLARVAATPEAMGDLGAYTYWAYNDDDGKPVWSSKFEDARSPAPHLSTAQVSAAWNEYLGRFVIMTSGSWDSARKVYIATAEHPWGPWSQKTVVYHLEGGMGSDFSGSIYCAFLHPVLFAHGGRTMYFSYSLTPGPGSADAPHLVELTLCTAEEMATEASCLGHSPNPPLSGNATGVVPPGCDSSSLGFAVGVFAVIVVAACAVTVFMRVGKRRAAARQAAGNAAAAAGGGGGAGAGYRPPTP